MRIADRYELIYEIGQGGMSTVHLALDCQTGEIVAVKLSIHNDEKEISRFEQEKEILKRINHDSIVKYKDSGLYENKYYIVMEYISGYSIGSESTPKDELIKQFIQICHALAYLEGLGIIHRDIKPSNIIISSGTPKLMNFGISHQINKTRITIAGSIIGTVRYMAPEQVGGQSIDHTVDLYALGVVMYELFTGELIFSGDNVAEIIYKIMSEKPINPKSIDKTIPKSLETIILRLLEKNPKQRYTNAFELASDLQKVLEGEEIGESLISGIKSNHIPLIGRTDIMETFFTAMSRALDKESTHINFYGPSGIGKSRLIEELRSQSLIKNARFLLCDPTLALPSKPAISSIFDQLSDYDINFDEKLLSKYAFQINDLSPKFFESIGLVCDNIGITSSNFPEILAYTISQAFKEHITVIAFEENLDDFTLDVLTRIDKFITSSKTIIISVSQNAKVFKSQPIIRCEKYELMAFWPSDIQELSKIILKKELSNHELAIIMDKSGGNPFFTISIFQQMIDRGTSLSLSRLPENVAEIYKSILFKLSPATQKAIKKMAIINCPIQLNKLNIMLGLIPSKVKQFLEEINSTNLVIDKVVANNSCIEIISKLVSEVFEEIIDETESKSLNFEIARAYELAQTNQTIEVKIRIAKHYLNSGNVEKGTKDIVECSKILTKEFKFDLALKYIEGLDESAENLNDMDLLADFYATINFALGGRGRFFDAEKYVLKMEGLIENPRVSLTKKVDLAIALCNHYAGEFKIQDSGKYAKIGFNLLDKNSTSDQASKINHFMAVYSAEFGSIEEAHNYANNELMYASISGNKSMIQKAYLIISYIKLRQGEFDLAIEVNKESIRITNELQDDESLLQALNNMAEIYFTKGEIQLAIDTLFQMRSKASSIFSYRQYAFASTNLIYALISIGKLKIGKDVCINSLNEFKITSSMFMASAPYRYLSKFYYLENDTLKLSNLISEMEEFVSIQEDKPCLIETKILRAKQSYTNENFDVAIKILDELSTDEIQKDEYRKIEINTLYSHIFCSQNEFSKALSSLEILDKCDTTDNIAKQFVISTAWLNYFYKIFKNNISIINQEWIDELVKTNEMGFERFYKIFQNTRIHLISIENFKPSLDYYIPETFIHYLNCFLILKDTGHIIYQDKLYTQEIIEMLKHVRKYMDSNGFKLFEDKINILDERQFLSSRIA